MPRAAGSLIVRLAVFSPRSRSRAFVSVGTLSFHAFRHLASPPLWLKPFQHLAVDSCNGAWRSRPPNILINPGRHKRITNQLRHLTLRPYFHTQHRTHQTNTLCKCTRIGLQCRCLTHSSPRACWKCFTPLSKY